MPKTATSWQFTDKDLQKEKTLEAQLNRHVARLSELLSFVSDLSLMKAANTTLDLSGDGSQSVSMPPWAPPPLP